MRRATVCIFLLLALLAPRARADDLATDFAAITSFGDRLPGSPGHARTLDYLRQQLAAIEGVEVREHAFDVMVPRTEHAEIRFADGRETKIAPFWPAHARLNATPAEGFSGRLVYVGDCEYDQLKPLSLRGNVAAIEAGARERWTRAFYFGARAVVVLPDANATNVDYRAFDIRPPANLPRFYCADAALATRLRAGEDVGPITLTANATWTKVRATNLYALITPRGGSRPLKDGDARKPAAMAFVVPYDSSSIVADAAPGASQAVSVAAGLSMARDLAASMQREDNAIRRPVMFAFTAADGVAQLGVRNLLLGLAETPVTWDAEIASLDAELATLRAHADRLAAIDGRPWTLDATRDRALIRRLITLVETDLSIQQDKLFRLRVLPTLTEAQRAEQKTYESNQVTLAGVRSSLQTDPRAPERPERRVLAVYYAQQALERLRGGATPGLIAQLEQRRADLSTRGELFAWLADRTGRDARPAERDTNGRVIEAIVGVDLSDRGSRVGPLFTGGLLKFSSKITAQPYAQFLAQLRDDAAKNEASAAWFKPIANTIELETLNTSRPSSSYVGAAPLASEFASSWGVAGLTVATLDDFRLRRDTPNDTADRVDLAAIRPQLSAVTALFAHALASDRFANDGEIRRYRNTIVGQVVGTAPGKPVPDLPLPGHLVSYTFAANKLRIPGLQQAASYATGVRRYEMVDTDAEGRYRIEGISRYPTGLLNAFVQCFFSEPGTGAIRATSDLGKATADLPPLADLATTLSPLRLLPFDCEEVSLVGAYDPRFLQSLGEVQIIDARRNTDAPRMSATLFDRILAAFVEPASRNYFLFRYGQIGNRLVLLNMPGETENASDRDARLGRGFTAAQIATLGPPGLQTASDFTRLDDVRLADYRHAGVSSPLIDSLHADAKSQLAAARDAIAGDDAAGAIRHGNGAWATEALVYSASKAMASDVVRAAIFLLLLAVPFSVCMERLLIASPNVYRQIAGVAGIFALMTGALWAFHPAFQITSSPLIIVLSFAIIFMSLVVIGVVYQKFDAELKVIRSGGRAGHGEAASFVRASVLTNAVMLGIANMRKRKIRTTLTALTIVLITFAVLVFASAASYRSTTSLPTGVNTDHPGLLLRQRGHRPMPIDIASELRVLFPDRQIVERWWNVNAFDPNETNLIVAGTGASRRVVGVPALLGLTPGEPSLSRIAESIGAEKFALLERGERDVIYLSTAIAGELKVSEGDAVRIGGVELKVAGVFDGTTFDRGVVTLTGESLTPLKFEPNAIDAGGRKLSDNAAESITLDADGGGVELANVYQHLPASQIAIVPAAVSRQLNNARLASVAVRFPDESVVVDTNGNLVDAVGLDDAAITAKRWSRVKRVKWAADEVARRFTIVTYAGLDDGVQMISASTPTKIAGTQVAIPLLIGGLIIFNTMMGSIAERKREIHIYTSLGLAPLHVGALFVAEALTYGVIGTVFGYICGQGLGTLLLKLGLLGNMTLDYSGTSAMLTIGLILAVVLLSALVPARLASRIAAPSIDRSWRVPTPVEGQIVATLPFTINRTAAEGVVAYLAEFFESHREGSIGRFAAGEVDAFAWTGEERESNGKPSRGVQTTIWLTPFDLGVRQHLMLLIHPGAFPEIYEVQVLLNRLSGDDGSWYRMNRAFLTELRKQFLQWRNLSPARMREYVEQSKSLFVAKV